MKKLLISLICLLLVCTFAVSCEKDPDKEIEDPNTKETTLPVGKDDDPNNGYGDIINPKD